MNTQTTQVYIIYSEIPRVTDVMNVKIGISIDVEDRLRNLQTSNPFKLNIIKSFDAGVEALKHEKYFHDLYAEYNTSGEWYKFETEYFEDVVLPTMYQYFNKIEVIQGEAIQDNFSTNLSLDELLEGTDNITYKSKYVDKKLAIIKLEKAKRIVDDNKKVKYQQIINNIQDIINKERDQLRRISEEKLAIRVMKSQAYTAKRKLQEFALGYLVGLSCA